MNPAIAIIPKLILLIVILVLGLILHFVTEWMKKKRQPEWDEFQEKVKDFNEKHSGDLSDDTKEFLGKHVNDSQTSHARYIIKYDENLRKDLEEE
ncbi:hypothetical protein AALA22_13390 [Anaerovoracaceae bacterium 41-7]|uniref:Uncharacterized protein n=1 Tax=Anaerotruncus colihominis TaxID=169435 RepID=A0A845QNV9_9FIRM|nr:MULTISPECIES: hypothetical protein [Anaerotruncus]NBH62925.1 hypothetical protein [Anaerotruncus colihominis]NCF03579.1 hypothetical protein [Anaerotruncus sp. 80]